MRILTVSSDWNVFNEDSAVARRQRLQASTVDRFDVFVPHGPRQTVHIAGNGTMRGFGPGKLLGTLRMLAAVRTLPRPDIVSSQDPFFLGFLAWLIAIEKGAKLHVQIHTDLFSPHFAGHGAGNWARVILARFILARADCVRVVSERIKRSLEPLHLSVPVSVLPVFVDTEVIDRSETINRQSLYPNFESSSENRPRRHRRWLGARAIRGARLGVEARRARGVCRSTKTVRILQSRRSGALNVGL